MGRQMWLASMRLLLTTTVGVLYQHRWSIIRAPDGISWLTSDDPVIRLNYNTEQDYDFGGGWGSPGSEFIFPLSGKHLLYTQVGKRHEPRITGAPELAQRLQRIIAEHAHRWIYSAAPLEDIETLRPRKVDHAQYAQEMREWKKWPQDQTAAERALGAGQPRASSP